MATSVPSCGMIQSAGRSKADPSGGPRRQSSSQTNHASFTGASFLLCGFVWPSVCSDEALTDFIAEGDSGRPAWNGRLHFRHKQNFPERWVVPRNDSGAGFGVFEELGIYLYLMRVLSGRWSFTLAAIFLPTRVSVSIQKFLHTDCVQHFVNR